MQVDKDEQVGDRLGPLPEPRIRLGDGDSTWDKYSRAQMLAYAAQEVAAERERCAAIAEAWGDYRGILAEVGPRIGRAIRGA